MSECPKNHMTHHSKLLAENWAMIHKLKFPRCSGLRVFECGDHYHVGHRAKKFKERCANRHSGYNNRGWKETD